MNRDALWIAAAVGAAWLLFRKSDPGELEKGTVYIAGDNLVMRAFIVGRLVASGTPYRVVSAQRLAEVSGDADLATAEAALFVPGYTVNWVNVYADFEQYGDNALEAMANQAIAQSQQVLGA